MRLRGLSATRELSSMIMHVNKFQNSNILPVHSIVALMIRDTMKQCTIRCSCVFLFQFNLILWSNIIKYISCISAVSVWGFSPVALYTLLHTKCAWIHFKVYLQKLSWIKRGKEICAYEVYQLQVSCAKWSCMLISFIVAMFSFT